MDKSSFPIKSTFVAFFYKFYFLRFPSPAFLSPHMVFDELSKKTDHPLVSIPKMVCEEAVSQGMSRIGLLGTVFTMEQDYMKKDLISTGVQVFVPNEKERKLIGKRIFEELEMGIVKNCPVSCFDAVDIHLRKLVSLAMK